MGNCSKWLKDTCFVLLPYVNFQRGTIELSLSVLTLFLCFSISLDLFNINLNFCVCLWFAVVKLPIYCSKFETKTSLSSHNTAAFSVDSSVEHFCLITAVTTVRHFPTYLKIFKKTFLATSLGRLQFKFMTWMLEYNNTLLYHYHDAYL